MKKLKKNLPQYTLLVLIVIAIGLALHFFPPTFYKAEWPQEDAEERPPVDEMAPIDIEEFEPIEVDFKESMQKERLRQDRLFDQRKLEDSLDKNRNFEPKMDDFNPPDIKVRDF